MKENHDILQCWPDNRESSIFSSMEPTGTSWASLSLSRIICLLFLCSFDIHQHPIQSENALLQCAGMIRYFARFRRRLPSWLALYHNIKVDKLLGKRRHVVFETKWVFANGVGCEDIVSLALTGSIKDYFFIGVFDFKIYVKGTTGLNLP